MIKRTLNNGTYKQLDYYFLDEKQLQMFKKTHDNKYVFQIRDIYGVI